MANHYWMRGLILIVELSINFKVKNQERQSLLGCDASASGAVNWVNENIVNVAVTRAKYRLYVIGDAEIWRKNPSLLVVQNRLEIMRAAKQEIVNT